MKGIAAVALLAGIAVAGPFTFEDAMADFEVRVASYLGDTPEVPGNKEVAKDRKALMKALAAIDKVQAKPSPLASVKCIAKQDKALTKEIPGAEMESLLNQVAVNAFEAAAGEVQALRDDFEALPSTPAGDAALLLVGALEDDLAAALLLPTRAERLKELSRLVKVHLGIAKKYGKVVKGLDKVSRLTATVNGVPYSDTLVVGSLILGPGGGVVSLTFSASEPGGPGTRSFVLAMSTAEAGGFITPGVYALDADPVVATAIYGESDGTGFPVLNLLGETGNITVSAIDKAKGTLSGTFEFSGAGGDVTGGTFFITGMQVVNLP